MAHTRDMNTAAITGIWALALGAAFLTLRPMLDFLSTTFSSLPTIGL